MVVRLREPGPEGQTRGSRGCSWPPGLAGDRKPTRIGALSYVTSVLNPLGIFTENFLWGP